MEVMLCVAMGWFIFKLGIKVCIYRFGRIFQQSHMSMRKEMHKNSVLLISGVRLLLR